MTSVKYVAQLEQAERECASLLASAGIAMAALAANDEDSSEHFDAAADAFFKQLQGIQQALTDFIDSTELVGAVPYSYTAYGPELDADLSAHRARLLLEHVKLMEKELAESKARQP